MALSWEEKAKMRTGKLNQATDERRGMLGGTLQQRISRKEERLGKSLKTRFTRNRGEIVSSEEGVDPPSFRGRGTQELRNDRTIS